MERISAMVAHLSDRLFNNISLSTIKSDGRVSEFSLLVLSQLTVRRHGPRSINAILPAIYRTTIVAVKPRPITPESDQVRLRLSSILKINVIDLAHDEWKLFRPSLTVGLQTLRQKHNEGVCHADAEAPVTHVLHFFESGP
jgi:hypothetical protein